MTKMSTIILPISYQHFYLDNFYLFALYKTLDFSNFVRKIPLILMKTESKVNSDVLTLHKTLKEGLKTSLNNAHIRLMSFLILALCKVQDVCLMKLANSFQHTAKPQSSMRRIQRFLADVDLDPLSIARFIFKLLPAKGPYTLSMDRTNWQFGSVDINALFLGITYNGVAFPLLFTMLPKKGNSNTCERIALMDRYIRLFGRESIECIVADREFVGKEWLGYLNNMRIPYHIRIKENFYAVRHGREIKVWQLFGHLKYNQTLVLEPIYYVNQEACYLAGSCVKNKEGKPELQVIVSYNNNAMALDRYKRRWQIETCFRAMKSSGFNIENTHLTDLKRIERLFLVMMIAFTWAYLVGLHQHLCFRPIRTLKNGRKAKSFLKYGLELIAAYLFNNYIKTDFQYFEKLSCT